MTQKAVSFNELMEGVLDQLRANGYMESTITIYRRTYTRIRVFLNRFDTDFYTPEIGTKFLAETNVIIPRLRPTPAAVQRSLTALQPI